LLILLVFLSHLFIKILPLLLLLLLFCHKKVLLCETSSLSTLQLFLRTQNVNDCFTYFHCMSFSLACLLAVVGRKNYSKEGACMLMMKIALIFKPSQWNQVARVFVKVNKSISTLISFSCNAATARKCFFLACHHESRMMKQT